MNELQKAREKITETDNKIAELFCERMEAVKQVANYKKANGLSVFDPDREAQVLKNGALRVDDPIIRSYYVSFLKTTMEISRRYQRELLNGRRIAYCGTEGAFAYIAAGKIFLNGERIAFDSFKAAYNSVLNGECDCAVLPVENSFAGDVGQVMDLMFSGPLYVNGMYELSVTHDLLGKKGATLKDIKTVVSHPQALAQCNSFIKENNLHEIQYSNTALAAEYVSKTEDKTVAAIASAESAEIFGLEILSRHINDSRTNTTRFAVFSRVDSHSSGNKMDARFSLVFTVKNEAGSLGRAINIIGEHGFNMRTLRSRPMKELLWEYYFYIEGEGDIYSKEGKECMEALKSCCDRLKIVGAYTTVSNQEEE